MHNANTNRTLFEQEYAEWLHEVGRHEEEDSKREKEKSQEFLYGTDFWTDDDESAYMRDRI